MLKQVLKLLRPSQWIKNGVVLAGLVFSGHVLERELQLIALQALVAFCLLSSAVYALNDIIDIERDRSHPLKKNRPLASGKLPIYMAAILSIVLAASGLVLAWSINISLFYVSAIYLVLNILYTLKLKDVVIIDVMSIAAGFVLRALAGAVAIRVEFSSWLLISTFVLALFLALGKRRHELLLLEAGASSHRRILVKYSAYLLDQLISVVTASTVITYLFYTLSSEVQQRLNTKYLFVTVPFVLYGIFRYLFLVHKEDKGGSPTSVLLNDRPLLLDVLLWLASVIVILYIF